MLAAYGVFPPNSVSTLGVPTVRVKDGCFIGGAYRSVRLIRCYLQCIHSPRSLRSAFRLRRLAESGGLARVLFKTGTSCISMDMAKSLGYQPTAPDAKVSKAGSGEVVEDFRKAEGPKHWASDLRPSMTPALLASRELRNLCCQQAHWRTREHHEEQRAGSGELRQRGLSSPFDISFHPAPYWVSPVADESAGEWKVAIPPFGETFKHLKRG